MEVKSITSLQCQCPPRKPMANNIANNSATISTPVAERNITHSIYFGQKESDDKGASSMRKAAMYVLIPATMLTAGGSVVSCSDTYDEEYNKRHQ